MLDFGFAELLVIIAISVLVMGPSEIPKLMLGLGRIMRRLQYVRYAISQQFDEFMQENDLDDIRKSVNFEAPKNYESFDEADEDESYHDVTPSGVGGSSELDNDADLSASAVGSSVSGRDDKEGA